MRAALWLLMSIREATEITAKLVGVISEDETPVGEIILNGIVTGCCVSGAELAVRYEELYLFFVYRRCAI